MTFCELFTEFCHVKSITAKPSTISTYKKIYEAQLNDYFKNTDISEFNNSLISNYILSLFNKGISKTYIKSITGLLYSVLNYAKIQYRQYIELAYIQKANISAHKKDIQVFCKEEQKNIENYILLHKTPFNVSVLLSLYTGIRIGELCALKTNNFDLNNKTVHISKTMQRVKDTSTNAKNKTKIITDTPKSEKSARTIPLPDFIVPILKELFDNSLNNMFFLTLSDTKFIEPRLYEKKFKKLLTMIGTDYKVPHTMRHTYANNMLDLGIDIKTLSELLGHSNVTITMNYYIHTNIERTLKFVHLLNNQFISYQKLS